MIIVKLIGGLGNQLFQYSVGRHLAEIHRTILKLDLSYFKKKGSRKYSLEVFDIQENIASRKEIYQIIFKDQSFIEKWRRIFTQKKPCTSSTYIQEKERGYNHHVLSTSDNVYLDGYWQSEKYFAAIEPTLRRELSFKWPQNNKNLELAQKLEKMNSISIHVRRGDYIANKKFNEKYGTCNPEYYQRSVHYLAERIESPFFYVFSDDPLWAKQNLQISFPAMYIDHNGPGRDYEDLRLMSQCKHQIIANSTFSWWAAWLNLNPEKIVIAPRVWFANRSIKNEDLIPDNWLKI